MYPSQTPNNIDNPGYYYPAQYYPSPNTQYTMQPNAQYPSTEYQHGPSYPQPPPQTGYQTSTPYPSPTGTSIPPWNDPQTPYPSPTGTSIPPWNDSQYSSSAAHYESQQLMNITKPDPQMATQTPNQYNQTTEQMDYQQTTSIALLNSPPDVLPSNNVETGSKFICHVVPFPAIKVALEPGKFFPAFMVYTQPSPPTPDPVPGQKEGRLAKSKRKWEKSKANAKAKGGIKSKAILGLDSAMSATKNTRVEFLSRCPKEINEFDLYYPPTMDPNFIQQMFKQMLEMTQKAAKRNVAISSALLPITFVVDLFCIFWPLPGPFFPVDAVWAFASYQAMNNSNTIIKKTERGEVVISYKQDPAIMTLAQQLEVYCLERDTKSKIFQPSRKDISYPTGSLELAQAVGYDPAAPTAVLNSETGLMMSAPQLPMEDVADDVRNQLKKSAKEYYSFVKSNRKKKT